MPIPGPATITLRPLGGTASEPPMPDPRGSAAHLCGPVTAIEATVAARTGVSDYLLTLLPPVTYTNLPSEATATAFAKSLPFAGPFYRLAQSWAPVVAL